MKRLAWVWVGLVGGVVLFITLRSFKGPMADTGLLSLLPGTESNPVLAETNDLISRRGSRLMAFALTDPDPDALDKAGKSLVSELESSGWVATFLTHFSNENQMAFQDLYFPLRYQLISQNDRQKLAGPHPLEFLVYRLRETLYSPTSGFLAESIPMDPFLFFPAYIKDVMAKGDDRSANTSAGAPFFLALEWNFDPFNSNNQEAFYNWLSRFRQKLAQEAPHAKVFSTGVMAFARAQRIQTERELLWMSIGSTIGVLGLLGWVFKKPETVTMALLPVGIGMLAGIGATLAAFGRIHIITLTFGTTLIGCSVDYPIHFLAHRRVEGGGVLAGDALKKLTPGLLLSMGTSVLGYLALGVAPLPGLRQIAVFSSVGLLTALATVYAWLPLLPFREQEPSSPHPLVWGVERCLSLVNWIWKGKSVFRGLFLVVLAVFAGMGLSRVRFDDDVRLLQKAPATVVQEDAEVRKAGGVGGNRFILTEGPTEEVLLRRQEILFDTLSHLVQEGSLLSVHGVAPFLPSLERQEADAQLVRRVLLSKPEEVKRSLRQVGLAPSVGDQLMKDLLLRPAPMTPDQWLRNPASTVFRNLWIGKTSNGFASATLVGGVNDRVVFEKSLAGLAGVSYFDQVDEFSKLLGRYRKKSLLLVGLATGLACVLLMFRYGFWGGLLANLPPLIGIVMTLSLFGWAGRSLNIFHVLAAVLVLAMGVDYAIFFSECRRTPHLLNSALLSVSLSAVTTLVSFCLLSFCSTPAVSALGQTTFLGLLISFCLSPLPWVSGNRESRP